MSSPSTKDTGNRQQQHQDDKNQTELSILSRFLSLSKKTFLDASSKEFSTKQMVMIHELLLDSLDDNDYNIFTSNKATLPSIEDGNDLTVTREWIKGSLLNERDVELVLSLFSSCDDDADKVVCDDDDEEEKASTTPSQQEEKNIETVAMVQYLLRIIHSSSSSSTTLSGLYFITLPLLLASPLVKKDKKSIIMIRDAILECTFLSSYNRGLQDEKEEEEEKKKQLLLLQACVDYCIFIFETSLSSSTTDTRTNLFFLVESISKIFLRLYHLYDDGGCDSSSSIIQNGMHRLIILIVQSLCYDICSADSSFEEEEVVWIRAVGTVGDEDKGLAILKMAGFLLLPVLYPSGGEGKKTELVDNSEEEKKRMNEIWNAIQLLISTPNKQEGGEDETLILGGRRGRRGRYWKDVAPTVATSLLCFLLPSPSFSSFFVDNNNNDGATLLLWSFTQHLLSQQGNTIIVGRDANVSNKTSSFLSSSTHEHGDVGAPQGAGGGGGKEQLLRRRGIYILRHLVELQASLRPLQGQQQEDYSKRVATWKKYILCFEALEMEEEAHLVDQTFPTIVELCSACCCSSTRNLSESTTAAASAGGEDNDGSTPGYLPNMTWEWVGSLLARVLLSNSPAIRKLGLFRLLNGDAGVTLLSATTIALNQAIKDDEEKKQQEENEKKGADVIMSRKKKPTKKHKIKKNKKASSAKQNKTRQPQEPNAPISLISTSYFLQVILPSYDSFLQTSMGTNMQYEHEGKIRADDLVGGFTKFAIAYVSALIQDEKEGETEQTSRLVELLHGLVQRDIILGLRIRVVVQTYNAIATSLTTTTTIASPPSSSNAVRRILIENEEEMLRNIAVHFRTMWNTGSVVRSMREALLVDLAKILSKITFVKVKRVESVLGVLGLYENVSPSSGTMVRKTQEEEEKAEKKDMSGVEIDEPYHSLSIWLGNIGNQDHQEEEKDSKSQWAANAGAACASAFVMGQLSPSAGSGGDDSDDGVAFHGCSESEVEMGRAIAKLCTLAASSSSIASSPQMQNKASSSELLWPAIHRGLSKPLAYSSAEAATNPSPSNSMRMERSLLLLEYGCKEAVLGGMGNGELLVDGKTGKMMTPPPNIESLLKNAVSFLMLQIELVTVLGGGSTAIASYRSSATNRASSRFARLIGQLRTLHGSYPASVEISKAVDELLHKSVDILQKIAIDKTNSEANPMDVVKHMALVYAVLTCGADFDDEDSTDREEVIKYLTNICNIFLELQFELPRSSSHSMKKEMVQTARSVFQYAKWGALSCLLPKITAKMKPLDPASGTTGSFVEPFYNGVFDTALDAVHATPADALLPLFECTLTAAEFLTSMERGSTEASSSSSQRGESNKSAKKLHKILRTLFTVMSEVTSNRNRMYMLHQICTLIFRPRLLQDEYEEWLEYDDGDADEGDGVCTPIRSAFRDLVSMAGTKKPHIAKFTVSNISVAWLGMNDDEDEKNDQAMCGLCAIPYRTDITDLLLYKESKIDQSSAHQDLKVAGWDKAAVGGIDGLASAAGQQDLPPSLGDVNDKSIVRGFLLLFLSKLPDHDKGLNREVLTKLLHFITLRLLKKVSVVSSTRGSALMTGSAEYCDKIRAWQALCLLSRFVTIEIASEVCELTFKSMSQNLHGQIRYFIEIFTIQCARCHPSIFGDAFVAQVRRRDASLQHISSLMIIGGNLIVGQYTVDFFRPSDDGGKLRLNEILAGVLPWLSSTQGFSRAIAQLLVHKLIPLVVPVDESQENGLQVGGSDWFLRSMFNFLEENPEMKRLRQKQTKFFDTYEVDSVCTPEGVLSIPVDESDEANPSHLVEAIKRCLENVYTEAHENSAPAWKQVDDLLLDGEHHKNVDDGFAALDNEEDETKLVNFQRKILPLDCLHLTMEAVREQGLKNAAGQRKQELIVCATLVDKVPNLAGLARTAEIFAADRLVIPDMGVCKMDIFKSVSVSAGDWIKIEECKENSLLRWLNHQKEDGYRIVGLEQTSSSSCISQTAFTGKTVLLLGKEKEGIPVEFLQVVDVCVEIPQLGIIRSLNVHVTGALAIWEYTKQMMEKKSS